MDVAEIGPKPDMASSKPDAERRPQRWWILAALGAAAAVLIGIVAVRALTPVVPIAAPRGPAVTAPRGPAVTAPSGLGESSAITSGESAAPASAVATYAVEPGDSLLRIAVLFDTTTEELQTLNGLVDADLLRIGQVLIVPSVAAPPPASLAEPVIGATYTVAEGDSLLSIAELFGVDPEAIVLANQLQDPDLVVAGEELRIPVAE